MSNVGTAEGDLRRRREPLQLVDARGGPGDGRNEGRLGVAHLGRDLLHLAGEDQGRAEEGKGGWTVIQSLEEEIWRSKSSVL